MDIWIETINPNKLANKLKKGEVAVKIPDTKIGKTIKTYSRRKLDRIVSDKNRITPRTFQKIDHEIRRNLHRDPFTRQIFFKGSPTTTQRIKVPARSLALRSVGREPTIDVVGIVIDKEDIPKWQEQRILSAYVEACEQNKKYDEKQRIKQFREELELPASISWKDPGKKLPDENCDNLLVAMARDGRRFRRVGGGPKIRTAKFFYDSDDRAVFQIPHHRDGSEILKKWEIIAWAPIDIEVDES